MPVGVMKNGTVIYSSARDIGNMAAGYEAGINGLSWAITRFFFDSLQKIQEHKFRASEGRSSQDAQYLGWQLGRRKYEKKN